jgi:hypothetical protein
LLVAAEVISPEQLTDAIEMATGGKTLIAALDDLGHASETTIARTIAEQMGFDFVDLPGYDIDPNAASRISPPNWPDGTACSRSRSRRTSCSSRCRIRRT